MPQLTYPLDMTVGAAGQQYDLGFNNVLTPVATEEIPIGLGTAKVIGEDYQVRLPQMNVGTVVASAALIAANSTVATVNGVALAPVVYATSNAATLTAIAAAIAAVDGIGSATSNGTNTITVIADQGEAVLVTLVTTLGASQATWTTTYSSQDVFYGVALRIQNKENLYSSTGSAGASPYYLGDAVPTLTRGRVWVTVEDTVTSDSAVYWRVKASGGNTQVGSFRSDADSGNAILIPSTQARWIIGATAGNIAVLDINQP
jgi:hypothetical protein